MIEDTIEQSLADCVRETQGELCWYYYVQLKDVRALVAEVRRLRAEASEIRARDFRTEKCVECGETRPRSEMTELTGIGATHEYICDKHL